MPRVPGEVGQAEGVLPRGCCVIGFGSIDEPKASPELCSRLRGNRAEATLSVKAQLCAYTPES